MAYEHKENRGSIFKNTDKSDPDSPQPDFTGGAKVNGKFMRVAGWADESKAGNAYISLSFTAPEDVPESKSELKDLPF